MSMNFCSLASRSFEAMLKVQVSGVDLPMSQADMTGEKWRSGAVALWF